MEAYDGLAKKRAETTGGQTGAQPRDTVSGIARL